MHAMRSTIVSALGIALCVSTLPPGPAAAARSGARHVLPWIADDYARAVAEAKARKVPLFIESWAPW